MLSYRYSYPIEKLDNLKILACNYTEEELFDYRKQQFDTAKVKSYSIEKANTKLQKIGFLSKDFNLIRPSGQLCQSFFKYLSMYRNYFEIHFFTTNQDKIDDEYKKYGIIHQTNIEQLGEIIYKTDIDILFDMQGCMINNFIALLESKPAKIQVHFIGYPGTMGISSMDYFIADKITIPEESAKYYCENIAYMPDCYQVNNENYIQRFSTFSLKSLMIPDNSFIMCCVNTTYKINRSTILFWLKLLKKIKNSILVLIINKNTHFENNIMNDAKAMYVSNQIRILHEIPKREHINRISAFHLNLDTIILNGHTSTSDCVAAGIPTVTLCSDTFHNRVSKSILTCLGLKELVANTIHEYEYIVTKLATNISYYKYVKNTLIQNRTKKLYNSPLYTRNFVRLLYTMWNTSIGNKDESLIPQYYQTNQSKFIQMEKYIPCELIIQPKNTQEWIYHSGKVCSGTILANVSISGEKLYQLATKNRLCTAFTTSGKLLKTVESVEDTTENGAGVWIKNEIEILDYKNIISALNYEYNTRKYEERVCKLIDKDMPIVYVCCYVKNNLIKMMDFFYRQLYQNIQVILITPNTDFDTHSTEKYNIPFIVGTDQICRTYNDIHSSVKEVLENRGITNEYYAIFDTNYNYNMDCIYSLNLNKHNLKEKNITRYMTLNFKNIENINDRNKKRKVFHY